MEPITFTPHGPFKVPYERTSKRTTFDEADLWTEEQAGALAKGWGCYILTCKHGKKDLPIYVGLTRASFVDEVFNRSNVKKFHRALDGCKEQTVSLYLIAHPPSKKTTKPKFIGELEDFFIVTASARNPDLQNRKGRPQLRWQVPHVTARAEGKPNRAARALRDVMGFNSRHYDLFAGRAFKNRRKGV